MRHGYLPEMTLGWLVYGDLRLATIEPPWIPVQEHRGGKPSESCVPDGRYELEPHETEGFPNVWALVNPDLDVHHWWAPVGRYAILIHQGNWVRDVVGCIAVGLRHGELGGQRAVLDSADAMELLRDALQAAMTLPDLEIRSTRGTAEIKAAA